MKVSAAKKQTFVEALVRGQTPEGAAKAIGVNRMTAYRWRAEDKVFAEQWAEACARKVEAVESVLFQQAMGGEAWAVIRRRSG
jgi:hypothetical protein